MTMRKLAERTGPSASRRAETVDRTAIETPHFDALTEQRKQFVLRFLTHGNATRAYREAGFTGEAAGQNAHILLKKSEILEAVAEMVPVVGVTPAEVKAVLAEIIRADPADLAPILAGMDLAQARAKGVPTHLIKRIRISRRVQGRGDDAEPYEDVVLELHDRLKALELVTRVLGMIIEKHAHDIPRPGRP